MGNTLIDEPVPATLSEPPVLDRPTLDDVAPGERRGPSPTLPDGPPGAGSRGASPTLLDGPPHVQRTPAAAPLHIAPASTPAAAPLPVAPAPAPALLPGAPASTPSPRSAPTPPPPPITPRPEPAPLVGAPPPLAYPVPGAAPGLLAQLPAMPEMRPMPARPPAPAAQEAPPAASDAPAPTSAAASVPAREAALPPEPAIAPAAAPPDPAPAPLAAPARLSPGARTLVGVAPPPPTPAAQDGGGYVPPGQTGEANPLGPTLPSMSALSPPAEVSARADEPAPERAEQGDPDAAKMSAPRSRARMVVAAILAVLGALAIAVVVVGYFVFFRATPLANRHIPGASNLAVRADVRSIAAFAPVRKHLWAALLERPSKSGGKTLSDRITEKTGIRPSIDMRELIVASVDSKSWVLLIGGSFKPGVFVRGMEEVLREDGQADWRREGDLLIKPGSTAIGQAEDGTIVIGTEPEIVTASLPASEEYKRVDLPEGGALSFAVSKEAWEELSRSTGAFDPAGALRRIRHVRGTLSLGDEPSVDLDIEPKGGEDAGALGKDVETFLSRVRLALVLLPDQAGEKAALSSAKVAVEESRVRVRAAWPLEGLDRGCEKLVGALGLP